MNIHRLSICILGFAAVAIVAQAQAQDGSATRDPSTGSLRGVTLGPGGLPLATVSVVVHGLGTAAERRAVSGADGVYVVDDLAPGPYQITASKDGFAETLGTTVEIAQNTLAKADMTLAAVNPASAEPAKSSGGFLSRFLRAYADDWKGSGTSGETPKYRGYPAPVTNPPFPFTIWPYGGIRTPAQNGAGTKNRKSGPSKYAMG